MTKQIAHMQIPKALRQLHHMQRHLLERMAQEEGGPRHPQISCNNAYKTCIAMLEAMIEYAAIKAAETGVPGCTQARQHEFVRHYVDGLTPAEIIAMMGD